MLRPWDTRVGRRWLGVLAAALLVGATIAVAVTTSAPPAADVDEQVPTDAAASDLAADACRYVTDELPADIGDDRPAEQVLARIERAALLAREAAARDQSHQALSGGISALHEALRTDDPDAATVAVRVVLANCPTSP